MGEAAGPRAARGGAIEIASPLPPSRDPLSQCLDDVISAHDVYLNEILDRALLAPQHETLNMQLQQLLQVILRFCSLEETLIAGKREAVVVVRVKGGGSLYNAIYNACLQWLCIQMP